METLVKDILELLQSSPDSHTLFGAISTGIIAFIIRTIELRKLKKKK